TKLSKDETVSMEILMKICKLLKCDIGDIMEFIPCEEIKSF
ncbi:MAG: helix-turn-helix transcriptional regulator, partial [Synergistaceae bacterium]|nr:helix-turn-helix transcriptional regulator [Synergistaceae bacterium]